MGILNNSQEERLHAILAEAYSRQSLTKMLWFRLGKKLDNIVGAVVGESDAFYALIETAEEEDWTADLIVAAQKDRPRNAALRTLSQELGLFLEDLEPGSKPGPNPKRKRWMATTLALLGILVGIVTLPTVIGNIPDFGSATPLPSIDLAATASSSRILWEKNWQQVKNRFQGEYCCPEGKTITNRERYLRTLNGLELTSDTEMQNDLENLIVLIERAEPYPDPNWNMVLTGEIEAAFDRLFDSIRNRAIENGVNVTD